jgi:hypothetical protein
MASLYPLFVSKRPWVVWWYGSHFTKSDWRINVQICWIWNCSTLQSKTQFLANNWYHYVSIYDWKQMKIYINWNLEDKIDTGGQLIWDSSWTELNIWSYFQWSIDEVRIYNRAISESEIKTLYNSVK